MERMHGCTKSGWSEQRIGRVPRTITRLIRNFSHANVYIFNKSSLLKYTTKSNCTLASTFLLTTMKPAAFKEVKPVRGDASTLERQCSLDTAANLVAENDICEKSAEGILMELDQDNDERTLSKKSKPKRGKRKSAPSKESANEEVVCAVCSDSVKTKFTKQCNLGSICCYQCLRQFMCVQIQKEKAPICPCNQCGKLDTKNLPYSILVKTLCPLCYVPNTNGSEFRKRSSVRSGCVLDHSFCPSCIREHLMKALQYGDRLPGCPRNAECRHTYDRDDIVNILDATETEDNSRTEGYVRLWHDLCVTISQRNHPLGKQCLRPDCDGFILTSWSASESASPVRARCTKCEFMYCATCMAPHHPGQKTCIGAKSVEGRWNGFLRALVDSEEGRASGSKQTGGAVVGNNSGSSAASHALLRIQQTAETNKYFKSLFQQAIDGKTGMKFCPNPRCRKIIEKTGACPSMICGKNHDDDRNNQNGCGKSFKWHEVPCATKEEIDEWLLAEGKNTFDSVSINTTDPQYETRAGKVQFHSKKLAWKKILCTQCKVPIKGTRFECIQCGGDSERPSATLCLECVTKHLDHHWGTTRHSGHLFSVHNPPVSPIPEFRIARGDVAHETSIFSLMNASDAMALSDTSCVSINEYPGALPVNLVRVELRPDGNLVYSDAAARAIGSLYLDNISYHLNRSENRSGMRSANDKLLEPKTFNLKPLEDVRVEEFSSFTKLTGNMHVETKNIYVPPIFIHGCEYRFKFSASAPPVIPGVLPDVVVGLVARHKQNGRDYRIEKIVGSMSGGNVHVTPDPPGGNSILGNSFWDVYNPLRQPETPIEESYIVAAKDKENVQLRAKSGLKKKLPPPKVKLTPDLQEFVSGGEMSYDQALELMPPELLPPSQTDDVSPKNIDREKAFVREASVWEAEGISGSNDQFRLKSVKFPGYYMYAAGNKPKEKKEGLEASVLKLCLLANSTLNPKRFLFSPKLIPSTQRITITSVYYGKKHTIHVPNPGPDHKNLRKGDMVTIRRVDLDEAKRLQVDFGGWASSMADMMGKTAPIETASSSSSGSFKVMGKYWNPAFFEPTEPCTEMDVVIDKRGTGIPDWSDAPRSCGPTCEMDHSGQTCVRCHQSWGVHNGHTCHRSGGGRGSWLIGNTVTIKNSIDVERVSMGHPKVEGSDERVSGIGKVGILRLPKKAACDSVQLVLSSPRLESLSLNHVTYYTPTPDHSRLGKRSTNLNLTNGAINCQDDAPATRVYTSKIMTELHGQICFEDGNSFSRNCRFSSKIKDVPFSVCLRYHVAGTFSKRPGLVGVAIVELVNGCLIYRGVTADSPIKEVTGLSLSGIFLPTMAFLKEPQKFTPEHGKLSARNSRAKPLKNHGTLWPAKTKKGLNCKACLRKGDQVFCASHANAAIAALMAGVDDEIVQLDSFLNANVTSGKSKHVCAGELDEDYLSGALLYRRNSYCHLSGRVVRKPPMKDPSGYVNTIEDIIREKGCGLDCRQRHTEGLCLRCGGNWGDHSGHNCDSRNGQRGSWAIDKGDAIGMWNPGDVIANLPPEYRPKYTCVFGALAMAAPSWPIDSTEVTELADDSSEEESIDGDEGDESGIFSDSVSEASATFLLD